MSSQAPTYSVSVTSDDLQAMKEVLYRSAVRQNKAFDLAATEKLGLAGRTSRRTLLMITAVGSLLMTALLAMTTSDDVFARVCLGGMLAFFFLYFFSLLVMGRDWLKDTIRNRFTDPLIRSTVNSEMNRSIKQAPYSVVYRFLETSYAASSPELKSDRTISVEDIAVAYKTESVFCLFKRRTSQGWKAIIYAPEPEHRNVVEAFLKGNQIEVRELDDQLPMDSR